MKYTYLKANKITDQHEISPEEDDNWYRVIDNQAVKIPGLRPHREICVTPSESADNPRRFVFDSGEEVRYRPTS